MSTKGDKARANALATFAAADLVERMRAAVEDEPCGGCLKPGCPACWTTEDSDPNGVHAELADRYEQEHRYGS